MTQHPAAHLAEQTASSARALAELLDPLRDALHPARQWPRPLAADESAALLAQVREAFAGLGTCVLGIAAGVGARSCPDTALRSRLFDATYLMAQALSMLHDTQVSPRFPAPRPPR